MLPSIDGFSPLTLSDKKIINAYLEKDPPEISELTFTNLFMWRRHYRPIWREENDFLLIICFPEDGLPYALPPVGAGDISTALEMLINHMSDAGLVPTIRRLGQKMVDSIADAGGYQINPTPDQSDYVYLTTELIDLSGTRFHQKKNHLNHFLKHYSFEMRKITAEIIPHLLSLQEQWCDLRECAADPGLSNEDHAVFEALTHFDDLDYTGLAILIEDKVEAFTLGEPLNNDTIVIHIEKANPRIRGLYMAINQRSCQELWSDFRFINREQDLGIEGLRKAKQSYNPHHMVNKYELLVASPAPNR